MGRWILGLRQSARAAVVRTILGWNPIGLEIDMMQISWWYRILQMAEDRWPKLILQHLRSSQGGGLWYENIQRLKEEYAINLHLFKGKQGGHSLRGYMEKLYWRECRMKQGAIASADLQQLSPLDNRISLTRPQKTVLTQLIAADFLSIVDSRVEELCPVCTVRWEDWRRHILEQCLSGDTHLLGEQTIELWLVSTLQRQEVATLRRAAHIVTQWKTQARVIQGQPGRPGE